MDDRQDHVEAWVCDQPPYGIAYRVVREEWITDRTPPLRLIYEVDIPRPECTCGAEEYIMVQHLVPCPLAKAATFTKAAT